MSPPSTSNIRLGHLNCRLCAPASPARGSVPGQPEPAGPPRLLLIHGLGGGLWGWERFQGYFAQCGYTSYALELPGHSGGSDPRPWNCLGYCSVETYALYAAAAIAELGPCVVMGHSLGGLIAQKLAETQPQLLGCVLLASAPPWHMFHRAYGRLWWHLLRHPWRQILAPLCGRPVVLGSSLQDELVNQRLPPELRANAYALDVPDSGRASMQMMAGLVSVDPESVSAPCLVVAGSADGLIPASEQHRLADFYRCSLQMYDRGHMLLIEDGWEEVAGGILDWVRDHCWHAQPELAATGS